MSRRTWQGRLAQGLNALLAPAGVRLVRGSSSEEFLLQGYQPVTCNGAAFQCDPHHAPFWTMYQQGRWEPETLAILDRFLSPQSVYYDIGSWIGPTVLYAARRSGAVFAFEPDPAACAFLLENVTRNELRHVRVFNVAVSRHDGERRLGTLGKRLGDSMSTLLADAPASHGWPVTSVSMDTVLQRFSCPAPQMMKIDIEGGEFELLPALRPYLERWRPILYLSLHAPALGSMAARERGLREIAGSLAMYPYAIERYDEWSRTGGGTMPLDGLAHSALLEQYGSLLLVPDSGSGTGPSRGARDSGRGTID